MLVLRAVERQSLVIFTVHNWPTIFDPFRSRASQASKSNGLGLGLFISQQIALAHGGDIAVQSNETVGTTFTVRIPRTSGDARTVGGNDTQALIEKRNAAVPMGHMGDGWDVAHAVLFLVSDEARFITATEIVVDGGSTAAMP